MVMAEKRSKTGLPVKTGELEDCLSSEQTGDFYNS